MKGRILHVLLLVTSLLGYLEWGKDNHSFLFEAEYTLLSKLFSAPSFLLHPFVLLPLVGQLLIVVTFFQKKPSSALIYTAIGLLGLLLGLMFFIGLLGLNLKILVSTLPFLITAIAVVRLHRRK